MHRRPTAAGSGAGNCAGRHCRYSRAGACEGGAREGGERTMIARVGAFSRPDRNPPSLSRARFAKSTVRHLQRRRRRHRLVADADDELLELSEEVTAVPSCNQSDFSASIRQIGIYAPSRTLLGCENASSAGVFILLKTTPLITAAMMAAKKAVRNAFMNWLLSKGKVDAITNRVRKRSCGSVRV